MHSHVYRSGYELDKAGKDFKLHLFARSPAYLPFASKLNTFGFSDRIETYFDSEMSLLDRDIPEIIGAGEAGKELYICGPQPFMDLFIDTAGNCGWDPAAVKFEVFAAVEVDTSNNQAFEITLARSNKSLTVNADQSIVDALENAGFSVPVSCGQGLCGTCVCDVVEGEVEHRDAILSDNERQANKKIALCVSRARSPNLVIDY